MFSASRSASSLPTILENESFKEAKQTTVQQLHKRDSENLYIKKLKSKPYNLEYCDAKAQIASNFVDKILKKLNVGALTPTKKELALQAVKYVGKEMLVACNKNPAVVDKGLVRSTAEKISKLIIELVENKYKTEGQMYCVQESAKKRINDMVNDIYA